MQVWDTAHETKSNNDFSACTTWGVWYNEESHRHELMLLNAIKDRWEFPQLKEIVLEQYKEWEPECLLVEKKAAGAPLIQELRQMAIVVEEYSPSRGASGVSNDKRARVNSVSPCYSTVSYGLLIFVGRMKSSTNAQNFPMVSMTTTLTA